MSGFISRVKLPKTTAIAAIVLAFVAGSFCLAQMPMDNAADADLAQPLMPGNELENLVAPVALYPDALLSQVLVASTYPLEVFDAQRWLQANGYLRGRDLMEAAQEQNWDASVQALVAFPDVVALLNRDISWTTALGNAFLEQQADVMNAIQNLRADARDGGQLESTPQLSVNTEAQGEQSAIAIQPADPQRMYVPNYDPAAVWGPPAEGDYPALPYAEGNGFGTLFGTVANLAQLLPGFTGLLGPQSWGWGLGWLAQTLFVNNSFFNDFGFHGGDGGSRGSSVWAHDAHRGLGGGYGNRSVAGRWGRGAGRGEGWRNFGNGERGGEGRRSVASYRSGGSDRSRGGEGFGRDGFQRDGRMERGSDWRQFNSGGRTASNRQFGRTFSPVSRTGDRWQGNRGSVRDGYSANSGVNRSNSFAGSRSFGSGSRYNGFGNSRGAENSRMLTASRSRGDAPRSGSERGSSFGRESSFGQSRHDSSWKHGFSSHGSKPNHYSAPKASKPHFAKSHGGGHSSGGHSGKRSHRG
jgi:Protein of unknown function (DUF3300)